MKPKVASMLTDAMARVTTKDLKGHGPKTEFLQFRVSKAEKENIQSTAEELGIQVSEYLLKLHELAVQRIRLE